MRDRARVIVVNTSFRLAPWADVLYACDDAWWLHYFAEVARTFKGDELWTTAPRVRDQFKLHYIYGARGTGLSDDDTAIMSGSHSGFQAIGLANHFGCKRIMLLGYDLGRSGGRVHWHEDHPRNKLGNGGRFHAWAKEMEPLAVALKARGVEVINCSRKTALTCYPRATIEEALPGHRVLSDAERQSA